MTNPALTPKQIADFVTKIKSSVPAADPAQLTKIVSETLTQADSDGDHIPDAKGLKSFFFKDGKFSKTAAFATCGNLAVLANYVITTFFSGSTFTLPFISGTIPSFNAGDAMAILGTLNATYIGNNLIKKKTR